MDGPSSQVTLVCVKWATKFSHHNEKGGRKKNNGVFKNWSEERRNLLKGRKDCQCASVTWERTWQVLEPLFRAECCAGIIVPSLPGAMVTTPPWSTPSLWNIKPKGTLSSLSCFMSWYSITAFPFDLKSYWANMLQCTATFFQHPEHSERSSAIYRNSSAML